MTVTLGEFTSDFEPEECALITGRKDTNFQRPWAMWKSRIATG